MTPIVLFLLINVFIRIDDEVRIICIKGSRLTTSGNEVTLAGQPDQCPPALIRNADVFHTHTGTNQSINLNQLSESIFSR